MNYIPAVCITVGIAIMSLTESSYMPSVSLNDKVIHALLYAVLAAAWWLAIKRPVWIIVHSSSVRMSQALIAFAQAWDPRMSCSAIRLSISRERLRSAID